ncbi:Acetyl esterase [Paraburkholderia domus]|uniref:alpha/beta hydrolase fold domain-containing protein n=1 Tax=Paraburkholderia domus TaxID=2793075 RepID=UPI001912BB59|nr:alpha/beta hydrolase fold domain-containing protein [Paraburkholderia domus]MBK5091560.1 alpha/beta hydrolase fold domain-containing protein [Burkholderia sp. R-69927]CAE6937296.1 Acetyl esterase [Paraburkholderia domus]
MPNDVTETPIAEEGAFRGGLLFKPDRSASDMTWVYFHGGGFVAGSPETHRCVTGWLASVSGIPVLSARYGLAPEFPYPAQRDDAIAACRTALSRRGATNDDSRIFLAGDSAGACVALWALRGMAPSMRTRVGGIALLYGAYGLRQSPSIQKYGTQKNGLDAQTLSAMYERLFHVGGPGETPPWPIDFAIEVSEPTFILAAELDAVFDDSVAVFGGLPPGQTMNRFVVATGQQHGFLKHAGDDPNAIAELEQLGKWAYHCAMPVRRKEA